MAYVIKGGPQGTTKDLVELWELNKDIDSPHARSVARAIEMELHYRPVTERIACGYPK